MLETIKFFFLGLIQGITEPIPVSSSGHLLILNHYFGVGIEEQQQLGFAVLVNFASLLAVLLIYRQDLIRLATNSVRYLMERSEKERADFRFVLFILLGTIPAAY